MGYFSNGSEGDRYLSKWCLRCLNWRETEEGSENWGCPIWDMHMSANYDQCGKGPISETYKWALEHFIPTGKDHFAEKCRMFLEKPDADIPGQMKMFEETKSARVQEMPK